MFVMFVGRHVGLGVTIKLIARNSNKPERKCVYVLLMYVRFITDVACLSDKKDPPCGPILIYFPNNLGIISRELRIKLIFIVIVAIKRKLQPPWRNEDAMIQVLADRDITQGSAAGRQSGVPKMASSFTKKQIALSQC